MRSWRLLVDGAVGRAADDRPAGRLSVLIDPPNAAGHGRLLVAPGQRRVARGAARVRPGRGVPERGFDRDHYDVPADSTPSDGRRRRRAGQLPGAGRPADRGRAAAPQAGQPRPSPARASGSPSRPCWAPATGSRCVAPAGAADHGRLAAGMDGAARAGGWTVTAPAPLPAAELPWLAGADDRPGRRAAGRLDRPRRRGASGAHGAASAPSACWTCSTGTSWPTAGPTLAGRLLRRHRLAPGLRRPGSGSVTVPRPRGRRSGRRRPGHRWTRVAVAALRRRTHARCTGEPGGGGVAEGVLVGGNLTLLAAMLGSAGQPPGPGLHRRCSRTSARRRTGWTGCSPSCCGPGWFDGVRGVACGSFTACGDPDQVRALLRARLEPLGVPLVRTSRSATAPTTGPSPLGRTVRLDGDRGQPAPSGGRFSCGARPRCCHHRRTPGSPDPWPASTISGEEATPVYSPRPSPAGRRAPLSARDRHFIDRFSYGHTPALASPGAPRPAAAVPGSRTQLAPGRTSDAPGADAVKSWFPDLWHTPTQLWNAQRVRASPPPGR